MGEGATPRDMRRYTVQDAADMLGITTGAVRNRLSRGTLRSVRESGRVYVLLPADTPRHTERDAERGAAEMPGESSEAALISEMRDRIADLREQVRSERQAHAEARRLLAAALERIPAIDAPEDASESAASPVPSQSAEPRSDSPTPTEQAGEPETPDTRPWWVRWFGSVDR